MSKHTPGPWFVDEDPREGMEYNRHVCAGPDLRICFMAHSGGKSPKRDEANARLIAAAPDLAEALEEAIIQMENDEYAIYGKLPPDPHRSTINKACAALDKARGETP